MTYKNINQYLRSRFPRLVSEDLFERAGLDFVEDGVWVHGGVTVKTVLLCGVLGRGEGEGGEGVGGEM